MFASQAINHGCLVVLASFTTASIKASCLGVQPSECQKYAEKARIPPRKISHAWAILPSLPGIEPTTPINAPELLSTATKTLHDVCLRSSLLVFSWVILTVSAANLHPCFASLLKCSSTPSFLILCSTPKKSSFLHSYHLSTSVSGLIRCCV